MGLFDAIKERALSGTIYTLYGIVKRRYPHASEADLLAETFKLRLKEISKRYPMLECMTDEHVREGLSGITNLDELVEFTIGFERKAKKLNQ